MKVSTLSKLVGKYINYDNCHHELRIADISIYKLRYNFYQYNDIKCKIVKCRHFTIYINKNFSKILCQYKVFLNFTCKKIKWAIL
jgi:hypothetical protein